MTDNHLGRLDRNKSLPDAVAERLSITIREGGRAPGERLPTERELAASFGVSRTIVREALGLLRQDGLIRSRQGSGLYVADMSARPLRMSLGPDAKERDVRNLAEILRALHGDAAGYAAQRRTAKQLAKLRQRYADLETAITADLPGVDEDIAFHREVILATGNPMFCEMFDFLDSRVRTFVRVTRSNSARYEGVTAAVQREHRIILDAIAERDADAASSAASDHVANAMDRLYGMKSQ